MPASDNSAVVRCIRDASEAGMPLDKVDTLICQKWPAITLKELSLAYREAGRQQLEEAIELERYIAARERGRSHARSPE